jgi:flagellar biosynthesis/type III secretory pathway protein FliH
MTSCSEVAGPPLVALSELEQLAPPPSLDPVRAAEAVIEAARVEANALRTQAVQDGFVEGMQRGREESAASLVPALEALRNAVDEAISARDAIVDGAEAAAARLAIAIAEKVVAGALEVAPERVVDVVRGALRGMLDGERIVVCVHPDDVDLVRSAGNELADSHIEIYAERRVTRGGALVRTSVGEIDARIETKLEAVQALVTAELRA